jgi:hypothetical protein
MLLALSSGASFCRAAFSASAIVWVRLCPYDWVASAAKERMAIRRGEIFISIGDFEKIVLTDGFGK